jgi:hypothetical protein
MKTKDMRSKIQVKITFQDYNTSKKINISGETNVEKLCSPEDEWICVENRRHDGEKWEVIESLVHKADVIKVVAFEQNCYFAYDPESLSVNATLDDCAET